MKVRDEVIVGMLAFSMVIAGCALIVLFVLPSSYPSLKRNRIISFGQREITISGRKEEAPARQ